METEDSKAARREYRREWAARKRRKEREAQERARLIVSLPPEILRRLERMESDATFWPEIAVVALERFLRRPWEPVAEAPGSSVPPAFRGNGKIPRDTPCPCESGSTWADCCGRLWPDRIAL